VTSPTSGEGDLNVATSLITASQLVVFCYGTAERKGVGEASDRGDVCQTGACDVVQGHKYTPPAIATTNVLSNHLHDRQHDE